MIVKRDAVKPFNFNGLSISDYTAGQEESSSLAMIEVAAGAIHQKADSKRSDKYYYLISGKLQFTIDAESCELEKGDFCLIKKGQHFSYKNTSGEMATIMLFHTPNFNLDAEVFL